jgi:hypothetical protein
MNFAKPFGAEVEADGNVRQFARGGAPVRPDENGDGNMGVTDLRSLLGRVSGNSKREIDVLISELQTLREKLETDSIRLQKGIAEYASLSEQVMELTKIVSESVHRLPDPQGPGA